MLLFRSKPRLRPDFRVEVGTRGPELFAEIRERLRDPDCVLVGQVFDRHAVIRIPPQQATLLSPLLDLELIDAESAGAVLRGRFTPEPNVWTGFMAVFATIGLLGLAGVMYGLAQITIDQAPWWLLSGPVAIAMIAFVYGAAFIGQGLSVDEIHALRSFVEGALRACDVEIPRLG